MVPKHSFSNHFHIKILANFNRKFSEVFFVFFMQDNSKCANKYFGGSINFFVKKICLKGEQKPEEVYKLYIPRQ